MPRKPLSRQAMAFHALLEPDSGDDVAPRKQSKSRRKKPSRRCSAMGDVSVPGFALKNELSGPHDLASSSIDLNDHKEEAREDSCGNFRLQEEELQHLCEAFHGSLSSEVVKDVYIQCGRSVAVALEKLLAISGGGGLTSSSKVNRATGGAVQGGDNEMMQFDAMACATVSGRLHHGRTTEDAAGTEHIDPRSNDQANSLWHPLPREVKDMVLGMLDMREKSRLACTCRDFANRLAAEKAIASLVRIPPSVQSMSIVATIVASYCRASAIVIRSLDTDAPCMRSIVDGIAQGSLDRLHSSRCGLEEGSLPSTAANALHNTYQCSSWILPVTKLVFLNDDIDEEVIKYAFTAICTLRAIVCKAKTINDNTLSAIARYRRDAHIEDLYEPEASTWDQNQKTECVEEGDHQYEGSSHRNVDLVCQQTAYVSHTLKDEMNIHSGIEGGTGDNCPRTAHLDALTIRHVSSTGSSTVNRGLKHVESQLEASAAQAARQRQQAARMAGLEELTLVGSPNITNAGVRNFLLQGSQRAPSLRALHLSRCRCLGHEAIRMHEKSVVEVLQLNSLPRLKQLKLRLSSSSVLRELTITNCKSLGFLDLSLPRLESLNVSGCVNLEVIHELRCPRLESLKACHCSSLTFSDTIAFECLRLKELSLNGCRSLESGCISTLANNFSELVSMDLCGCTSISHVDLCSHVPSGLLRLQKLKLDGCTSLWSVKAAAVPNLKELSLSGCRNVRHLSLPGARPNIFNVRNCQRLQEIYIGGGEMGERLNDADCHAVTDFNSGSLRQKGGLLREDEAVGVRQRWNDTSVTSTGRCRMVGDASIDLRGTESLGKDAKKRVIAAIQSGHGDKHLVIRS